MFRAGSFWSGGRAKSSLRVFMMSGERNLQLSTIGAYCPPKVQDGRTNNIKARGRVKGMGRLNPHP